MLRGECGERVSVARLVGELKAGERETQSGGSISGVFPPEWLTRPQMIPVMRCGRGMQQIE